MKKDILRDLLALGGWPIYVLVLARSAIGPYWDFFIPVVVAGLAILALEFTRYRKALYIARVLVLAVFTIRFYNDLAYTIFALLIAAVVIGTGKDRLRGIGLGVAATLLGWGAGLL